MFPSSFEYHRAQSVNEAVELLDEHRGKNPSLLAGGHSLIPMMKQRLAQPGVVVDIRTIDGLDSIETDGDTLRIGALARHVDVETSDRLRRGVPCLAEAASEIGDVQIRNRGTIGGNLANADPGADFPAPFLALGGTAGVEGPQGSRRIPAEEFFQGMFTTALDEDEILTHLEIPTPSDTVRSTYAKKTSPSSGYALVGVAAVLDFNGGTVRDARLAVNGVTGRPVRLTGTEEALNGESWNPESIDRAARAAGDTLDENEILSDVQAGPDYRLQLLETHTRKALEIIDGRRE